MGAINQVEVSMPIHVCWVFLSEWSLSVVFVTDEFGLHSAGRACVTLRGLGCTGICWNVAEKWAFTGQPGIFNHFYTWLYSFHSVLWIFLLSLMHPWTLMWAGLLLPGCKMQGRDVWQGHSHASGLLQSNTIVVPAVINTYSELCYKWFTDRCLQDGAQPLSHVDPVEIWTVWSLQWKFFKQRPSNHFWFHVKNNVLLIAAVVSDWMEPILQDELFQRNRLIEEMLYLLIVIIGIICQ